MLNWLFFSSQLLGPQHCSAQSKKRGKKEKKAMFRRPWILLWVGASTLRKCFRTRAVWAPLSGSGRPCGPRCCLSRSRAAAAWVRTRWPRSGWSCGWPLRVQSPWGRAEREVEHEECVINGFRWASICLTTFGFSAASGFHLEKQHHGLYTHL